MEDLVRVIINHETLNQEQTFQTVEELLGVQLAIIGGNRDFLHAKT